MGSSCCSMLANKARVLRHKVTGAEENALCLRPSRSRLRPESYVKTAYDCSPTGMQLAAWGGLTHYQQYWSKDDIAVIVL